MRMNIEVGLTPDLVARNKMAPFIFAVNQYITEFEILYENDGCSVVHDVLQSLFAITQRLLGPLALFLGAERCNAIRQVVRQFRVLLNGVLIKGIGLFGIKTKTANTFSISDQRERNARSITARNCGGSPRSQTGFGSDVFDPAGFARSEGDARRTPASGRFFAPGNSSIFQVIESGSSRLFISVTTRSFTPRMNMSSFSPSARFWWKWEGFVWPGLAAAKTTLKKLCSRWQRRDTDSIPGKC